MSQILDSNQASLFAGRETRNSFIQPDAWRRLTDMGREMKNPGFADMQIDKYASAVWLSEKLQRPIEETTQNWDAYARSYFGKDMTPGSAYDRIVQIETDLGKLALPAGQQKEVAGADAEVKPWQFMRAAGAGFAKAGHDTAGGTLAMIEGALNTLGGMPERKGVSEFPDYADAAFQMGVMEYEGTLDTPEGRSVVSRLEAGRVALDADFKARMDEYHNTIRGGLAEDVRRGADFFYELGEESARFYGVDPSYRETAIGKAAEMGGNMFASSALLAAGSLGALGRVKGAARVFDALGTGMIYAGVEQDRMTVEGEAYRNTGWTFAANMASAGVQQYIERASWLDNTLEKAIKRVPRKGGVVSLGAVLREIPRESVRSGLVEGVEEVLQGSWDDFVAEMAYDDTRIDLSDGKLDFVKRRAGEALAGFGGGVLLGAGFSIPAGLDARRAARASQRAFDNRKGDFLTAEDLTHLRQGRTDEQILSMPEGKTLLEAANGSKEAAVRYNQAIFDASFIKTDGMTAFGMTVGEYKGMPALSFADGRRLPFDPNDSTGMNTFNAIRRKIAASSQGDAVLDEFQARFGEALRVERKKEEKSLEQLVTDGVLTREEAEDALNTAKKLNGLAEELTLADVKPQGRSTIEQDAKTKVWRMVASVMEGKSPDVAIEEVAESWKKKAIADGQLDPMELRSIREQWHEENGETDPAKGDDAVDPDRADTEWFSKRVIEYAVAGKHTEVTGKWWQWIRQLGDNLRDFLRGAKAMRAKMNDGTLDPRLESWFKAALGVGDGKIQTQWSQKSAEEEAAIAAKDRDAELANLEAAPTMSDIEEEMFGLVAENEKFPKLTGNEGDGYTIKAPGEQMSFSLAQTETPDFKAWFGESKVVDAHGKPLVVYHGTIGDIQQFDASRRGESTGVESAGMGFFFTADVRKAESYGEYAATDAKIAALLREAEAAERRGDWDTYDAKVQEYEALDASFNEPQGRFGGQNIVPVYLAMRNPLRVDAKGENAIGFDIPSVLRRANRGKYDGVIIENLDDAAGLADRPATHYVVFEPTQIKSAIGNRGTFDPTNPDITFSLSDMDNMPDDFRATYRKAEEQWEQWMAKQGFAEVVRMRNESYIDSLVTVRAKHAPSNMAVLESVISPVAEAIRRAGAKEVSAALIRNTADAARRKERDRQVVTAYASKVQKLDEGVYLLLDQAAMNSDRETMNSIAERYGFRAELDAMFALFDRIRHEATKAGVPVGTFWNAPDSVTDEQRAAIKASEGTDQDAALIDAGYTLRISDYWPRIVIDYDAYLSYLTGTEEGSSELGRAYQIAFRKAEERGTPLTTEELDAIASKGVSELKRKTIGGRAKPSALKQRKIEQVDLEAVRFYKKHTDAAYTHVERMHDYIAVLSFFGDKAAKQDAAVDGLLPVVSVKESVKLYVADKNWNARQVQQVRRALEARFGYVGSPAVVGMIKTFGYLQGMTQIYTPLTAVVPDVWNVALESNFDFSTFVSAVYQAATGKSAANIEGFGLNSRALHREFQTQMGGRLNRYVVDKFKLRGKSKAVVEAATLSNTLDVILRSIGLNKLNDFVQQSRANAELIALRKAVTKGSFSRIQQNRLDRLFREEEKAQLLADVKDGKGVNDSEMIAYYAWSGMADYMPISLDQMPEQFLKHPVGRVGYMFKTFLVMQTAAIRREGIDAIVEGVEKKDTKQIAYGVGMILFMVSLIQMFGMPPDVIRAYIQNRTYVFEDEFYNKLLGLIGVSHFVAMKARQGDFTGAVTSYLIPPASVYQDAYRDARDIWDGKMEFVDGEYDLSQLRIWNYTPVAGRTYQGWWGDQSDKRITEIENEGRFKWTHNEEYEAEAEEARRRQLERRYAQ